MTWKRLTLMGAALLLVLAAMPLIAQDRDGVAEDFAEFDAVYFGDEAYFGEEAFYAQQRPMRDGSGPNRGGFSEMREQIPEELRLTDEQREKMRNLRTQHQKEMIPMRADLKVLQVELRELMADNANESTLNGKIDQIGKLRTEIQKKRMTHHLAMRDVLTEEQRDAFKGRRMGGHGDRGGSKGCGGCDRHHRRGECNHGGPRGPRGGGHGR